jgi:predicted nucleic acid-binding protein
MSFLVIDNLPDKSSVFIDANIFIYHFAGVSNQCTNILYKVMNRTVDSIVSTIVIAEVIHRRMIAEAIDNGLATTKNVIKKLKNYPDWIKNLTQYSKDIDNILSLPITVGSITKTDIINSTSLRSKYGLLTNDSLNLAFMKRNKITHIITHDSDFDAISDITVLKPTDINIVI